MGRLMFAAIVFVLGRALYVGVRRPGQLPAATLAKIDTLGGSGAVPFLQIPTPGEGRR